MKNLTLLFLLISIFFFSCKKNPSNESIVYDNITVHLGEVIPENYGGWILISDDDGNLLGEQPVLNNTIAEVEYDVPVTGNKHLTLFMLKKLTTTQESDSYVCQTFTNISSSPIFMKFNPNLEQPSQTVTVELDMGALEDITVSSAMSFRSKHINNLNDYGLIRVPDSAPYIFVAVLKENEDFWRYGMIPTNGNTILEVSEEDLEFQTPNAHLSTSFEPNDYRIEMRGIKESNDGFSRWGLNRAKHNSSYFDILNGTITFNSIEEHSLISTPEGFTKFETEISVWDTTENIGYKRHQVGEQVFSFNPDPIAFQVIQNNNQEISVINESDYSHFYASWYDHIDLPNGRTFYSQWYICGEFEEVFQFPKLPNSAMNIIPEEIQPGNLPISYVSGIKDSRYSNYTEFLQKYLHNNQEFHYLFNYPEFDFNEDATLEMATQSF